MWNSIADVIGSVANYFSQHSWQAGAGVVYPVTVKDKSVVREKNSLEPYTTLKQLQSQGVALKKNPANPEVDKTEQVTLLKLEGKKGDEYWLGLKNFYVITRYNHSVLYAMAVYQLSEKLKN